MTTDTIVLFTGLGVWILVEVVIHRRRPSVADYYRNRIRKPLDVRLACRHLYGELPGYCCKCGITEAEWDADHATCREARN